MSAGNCGPQPGSAWKAPARAPVDSYASLAPLVEADVLDFDAIAEVTLSAASTAFSNVVTYEMPRGYWGHVLWVGMDADVAAAFQNVNWRVTVNERVYLYYPNLGQFAGMLPSDLSPSNIPVFPGAIVRIDGVNEHGTTDYVVRARLKGIRRSEFVGSGRN